MPLVVKLAARERGALPLFELDVVRPLGVDAVITRRDGGVSPAPFDSLNRGDHVGDEPALVVENRRRVATAMGLEPDRLVIARQVHGNAVCDLDDWNGETLEGDALVTTRQDVAVAVLVADCVPLLLVDAERVGVAHAGWRGMADGMIAAVLSRFASPADVRVVVGPHVSPARYQVGPEVAERFADVPRAVVADEGDRWRLDLGVVATRQLLDAGVASENVWVSESPTDDARVFFSDRFARPCGRFALVARRRPYDSQVREEQS